MNELITMSSIRSVNVPINKRSQSAPLNMSTDLNECLTLSSTSPPDPAIVTPLPCELRIRLPLMQCSISTLCSPSDDYLDFSPSHDSTPDMHHNFDFESWAALQAFFKQLDAQHRLARSYCVPELLHVLVSRRKSLAPSLRSLLTMLLCLEDRIESMNSSNYGGFRRFAASCARSDEDFFWRLLPKLYLCYIWLSDDRSVSLTDLVLPLRNDSHMNFSVRYPHAHFMVDELRKQILAVWSCLAYRLHVEDEAWQSKWKQLSLDVTDGGSSLDAFSGAEVYMSGYDEEDNNDGGEDLL